MNRRSRVRPYPRPVIRQRQRQRRGGFFGNLYNAGGYVAPFLAEYAGRAAQRAAQNVVYQAANRFMATPGPAKKKKRTVSRKSTLGTYAGKTKRSTKKGMDSGVNNYAKYGVVTNRETNNQIEDPDCVYVGHSSIAANPLIRTVWYAVIKKIFKMSGIQIRDMTEGNSMKENFRVVLTGKTVDNDNQVQFTNISVLAGVGSYEDIANHFSSWIIANWFGIAYENAHMSFLEVVSEPAGGDEIIFAHLNLEHFNVSYFSKSTLRMQNRTQPPGVTDAQADDVNNVPLTGRSYLCKGASPQWTGRPLYDGTLPGVLFGFVIDSSNGTLQKAAQQNPIWTGSEPKRRALREPVLPKSFKNCYKSAKQRFQPGEIKISTLYDTRKMDFNYFHYSMRIVHALGDPLLPRTQVRVAVGKCEIFAFEEMISYGEQKVTVTWEVDRDQGAMLVAKKTPITSKLNFI
jgi:hypothetical protein